MDATGRIEALRSSFYNPYGKTANWSSIPGLKQEAKFVVDGGAQTSSQILSDQAEYQRMFFQSMMLRCGMNRRKVDDAISNFDSGGTSTMKMDDDDDDDGSNRNYDDPRPIKRHATDHIRPQLVQFKKPSNQKIEWYLFDMEFCSDTVNAIIVTFQLYYNFNYGTAIFTENELEKKLFCGGGRYHSLTLERCIQNEYFYHLLDTLQKMPGLFPQLILNQSVKLVKEPGFTGDNGLHHGSDGTTYCRYCDMTEGTAKKLAEILIQRKKRIADQASGTDPCHLRHHPQQPLEFLRIHTGGITSEGSAMLFEALNDNDITDSICDGTVVSKNPFALSIDTSFNFTGPGNFLTSGRNLGDKVADNLSSGLYNNKTISELELSSDKSNFSSRCLSNLMRNGFREDPTLQVFKLNLFVTYFDEDLEELLDEMNMFLLQTINTSPDPSKPTTNTYGIGDFRLTLRDVHSDRLHIQRGDALHLRSFQRRHPITDDIYHAVWEAVTTSSPPLPTIWQEYQNDAEPSDSTTMSFPFQHTMISANSSCRYLERLTLSKCGIGNVHLRYIFDEVLWRCCPTLLHINLSGNLITDLCGSLRGTRALQRHSYVRTLDLSDNLFSGQSNDDEPLDGEEQAELMIQFLIMNKNLYSMGMLPRTKLRLPKIDSIMFLLGMNWIGMDSSLFSSLLLPESQSLSNQQNEHDNDDYGTHVVSSSSSSLQQEQEQGQDRTAKNGKRYRRYQTIPLSVWPIILHRFSGPRERIKEKDYFFIYHEHDYRFCDTHHDEIKSCSSIIYTLLLNGPALAGRSAVGI